MKIDWRNPLTKGLKIVHAPSVLASDREVVTGTFLPNTREHRAIKGEQSIVYSRWGDVGETYDPIETVVPAQNSGDHTFLTWWRCDSIVGNQNTFMITTSKTANNGFRFGLVAGSGTAPNQTITARFTYGGVADYTASSSFPINAGFVQVGFSGTFNSDLDYVIDGSFDSNISVGTISSSSDNFTLYGEERTADASQGEFALSLYWERRLSETEVAILNKNPWQIFKRPPIIGAHQLPTDVRWGMIKKPWTEQPPAGTPIDWSNPLSTGLVSVFNGNQSNIDTMIDSATGKPDFVLNASGGGTIKPSIINASVGRAASNRADEQYYWKLRSRSELAPSPSNQSSASLFSLFRVREHAPNGAMPFGSGETATSSSNIFCLKIYAASVNCASYNGYYANGGYSVPGGVPTEEWLSVGGTYNGNSARGVEGTAVYYQGDFKDIDTSSSPGGLSLQAGYNYKIANGQSGDVNREWDGDVAFAAAWNGRVLTEGEMRQLHENPWQIFEPQEIWAPINEELPELGTFDIENTEPPTR